MFETYYLRPMELSRLAVRYDFRWKEDPRVVAYSRLSLESVPPIVLGCVFISGKYDVVDGHHRVRAFKLMERLTIPAYVPENPVS